MIVSWIVIGVLIVFLGVFVVEWVKLKEIIGIQQDTIATQEKELCVLRMYMRFRSLDDF